jgi:PTS system nitrogen regulatory IIA component
MRHDRTEIRRIKGVFFGINCTMDVNLALSPEAIAFARLDTKPKVLVRTAELLSTAYGLDHNEVLENLEAREALGSTGFGRGVAIPHCRLKDVRRPSLALIRLEAPIDFSAADSRPVSLICGLVSPESAGATHLHALAAISRLTRDETMLQMLAEAPDTDAVYALLTNQLVRDAA